MSMLKSFFGIGYLLLDEYDVPLAKANEHGYYDQMIMLVRGLFEQVLKKNDSLFCYTYRLPNRSITPQESQHVNSLNLLSH